MTGSIPVLYVEPDPAAVDTVVTAVSEEYPELSITAVGSAAEARDRLADGPVGCVVSAYDLPDANGLELLEAVGSEHRDLPTVLVAGRDDGVLAREALSAGVSDYLRRSDPIEPALLVRRIEGVVPDSDTPVERSGAHVEALTHAASDVIVTVDEAGTIRFVNEAVEDVFGYRPEELVGEPVTTLVSDVDTDRYLDDLREYLRTDGEADWGHTELTGCRKDDSTVPLELSFGRFEYDGRRFITGIARDISEHRRLRSELDELIGRVTDAFYGLDSEWRFTYLNERADELINPEGKELIGETVWEQFPGALDTGFEEQYRRAMETQTPVAFEEHYPEPLDSWFEVRAYPSETGLSVYFQDIDDRKRRERQLETLNEVSQELTTAETIEGVDRIAIEAVDETLSLPIASIKVYNSETGYLEPVGGDWDSPAVGRRLFESRRTVPWQVFASGEPAVYDDLNATDLPAEETPLRSAIVLPLGKHGVLIAGSDEPDAISEDDVALAEILAANTTSALDRVDRERALREQTERLEEQNTALERVQRLNAVIRGIVQELTHASTHETAMQAVCDRLADSEPYRFVWIGIHDPATDEITPEAFGGVEEGYLDEITVTADESSTGMGPAGRAFRSHEPSVQNDLYTDPPFEPWRQAALERGYRSSISIPIVHRDTIYGVLNLYAEEANAFNGTERDALGELGETIGYALNALDRKRDLVSDRSLDLEFRLHDPADPLLALLAEHDYTIEFENTVHRADDSLQAFVAIDEADPETVSGFEREVDDIEESRFVREQDGAYLFAWTLAPSSFFPSLVDQGVLPRLLAADADGGRAVVRISRTAAVRSVIDRFEARYDEVELIAQRERDEPITTQREFETEFKDLLTDRQEEILRLATVSGFFEWPRATTAQQIADMIGVSQPTVSRHLRAGERTLFDLLFEGD
ncbi:bacterio-opsin activator domain-containing protein [Halalkalicoccus tibetensis]|uniref:Bacterio-opsin activator domain-containing protein n=1 Tax=Halalkalicoccus tibetensis TaxID=175632 RepID=A0ABD5V513_9EURY